jgi:hypothetical protein
MFPHLIMAVVPERGKHMTTFWNAPQADEPFEFVVNGTSVSVYGSDGKTALRDRWNVKLNGREYWIYRDDVAEVDSAASLRAALEGEVADQLNGSSRLNPY